jgi:hypothetical protein
MNRRSAKAAIVAGLAGMLVLHAVMFWNEKSKIGKVYPDFTIFYAAGKILSRGEGHHLYDLDLQLRVEREFAAEVGTRQGALPFNHPPFEALLFLPLARLGYVGAYAIWNLCNLAILFALPWVLRRHCPVLQERGAIIFCFGGALAFFPVFVSLLQGQDILLLVLLHVLAFIALKRNSDFSAGCWLGLGMFRIHLVLPVIALLLAWRRYRAGVGFALTSLCLAAVSIGTVGWEQALRYPQFVLHLERVRGWGAIAPASMPNLRGLIEGWSWADGAAWTPWLTAGLSMGLLLLVATFFRGDGRDSDGSGFDLAFSAAVVTTLLISYHTLPHDLCLLLLPVLLLVNRWSKVADSRKNLWLVVSAGLLFLTPLYTLLGLRGGHFNGFALLLLGLLTGLFKELAARSTRLASQYHGRVV